MFTLLIVLLFLEPVTQPLAQPEPLESELFEGALVEITDLGECGSCGRGITRNLQKLEGVLSVVPETEGLSTLASNLRVKVEKDVWLDTGELRETIRNVGYTAGKIESWGIGSLKSLAEGLFWFPGTATSDSGIKIEDLSGLARNIQDGEEIYVHLVVASADETPVLVDLRAAP